MPEQNDPVAEQRVRVRRSPRYARFMVVSCLVLLAAAFVATYSLPETGGYDRNEVFGFVALGAVAVGIGLGGAIALAFDRIFQWRAKVVLADRSLVREVEDDGLDAEGELRVVEDSAAADDASGHPSGMRPGGD